MSEIIDPIDHCRGSGSTATIMQPGLKACNRCVINKDGDLLFVASEKFIYGYNLLTEVCFRVYEGHDGIVEDLDVDDYHIVAVDKDIYKYESYFDLHEVYTIFYHDLDSKYIRNLEPDEDGRYYKDKYHYYVIGELTIDDITSGAYIVSNADISVFENYSDCEIIEFDDAYVVIVPW